MENKTYHPSKSGVQHQRHQRDDQPSPSQNGSSGAPAPASVEALKTKISVLQVEVAQSLRDASCKYNSPSTSFSEDATAAARGGGNVQILRVPIKSEDDEPGPTLNPASCASGLALLSGDGDVIERMNHGQGNTHRRNFSLQNEDWDDSDLPQGNQYRGVIG